jgi:hypothetical protein
MKKLAFIMVAVATLSSNVGFAQSRSMGSGAQAATYSTTNMAWGIGLGMLVVVGVVVGLTAGAAAGSPSSFSH